MKTLKTLAQETGTSLRKLETQAAAFGFNKGVDEAIPEEILAKINDKKQLLPSLKIDNKEDSNSENTSFSGSSNPSKNIHQAHSQNNQRLDADKFELEKEAARVAGKMEAHQIYMNYYSAKMDELRFLKERDSLAAAANFSEKSKQYQESLDFLNQKAIEGWANGDKSQKTISECMNEVRALNASFGS